MRRFTSRREKCLNIYSDNGSNFVGARKIIKNFLSANSDVIKDNLAKDSITWYFMPARTAHFGRLWESGIRNVKYHLNRVIGNALLTFEEVNTVLAQIKACINSRTLHPMSHDPGDAIPITPAYFLIGYTLISVPDKNYVVVKINTLTRF